MPQYATRRTPTNGAAHPRFVSGDQGTSQPGAGVHPHLLHEQASQPVSVTHKERITVGHGW